MTAGRVQSVALRLIIDREKEIEAFVPDEYWSITAELQPDGSPEDVRFQAKLTHLDGKKLHLGSKDELDPVLADLGNARYEVRKIHRGTRVKIHLRHLSPVHFSRMPPVS